MTRTTRTPVTTDQALTQIRQAQLSTVATGIALSEFMASSAIPDAVVVSLALRSRSLLLEAAEHLQAAVQRLEGKA
jgi:hypothetical protein